VRAARDATQTIPIVFTSGSDPVRDGIVKSLSRPDGNTTGVHVFTASLGPKRLELLCELVPAARHIAFIANPTSEIADAQVNQIEEAAGALGRQLLVLKVSSEREIERAFRTLVQQRADALLMSADTFFQVRREQLIALAAHHAIPTMYEWSEFVKDGGLISYSPVRTDMLLKVGVYVGRILNGAKPAELPVEQPTRFELVINLTTAKALGLTIPPSILIRADEVIE
jgi:putative tryptophan/tyrosine transport system substrate-binding protein